MRWDFPKAASSAQSSGNLHSGVIAGIIMRFIDLAVKSADPIVRNLSISLYSIRYGCDEQMLGRLLATLSASIKSRLVSEEERLGILPLSSFGVSSLREDLCNLLFAIYCSALSRAKQGEHVVRSVTYTILEAALNDPGLRDSALETIRALCSNSSSAILPAVPSIVKLLISKLDVPSGSLFETLAHICRLFGPSSTLFRHVFAIFSAMKHPLDEQEYGNAAARLLSAIVNTSAFLISPEVSSQKP
ncbi:hypothetical protein OESDEN_05290 [Oesophagostomum dentatum]|uniref:HEAT repeat protein n=1 Tax=Oesophagostomum dentatum TaxID=61180 RepID=A0A0B1TBX2_OESDE|nr:hypothetical protein OESDEN_05290 [Oesophagostomum dentatum]